jgi:predicted amidohydrolase
MLVVMANHGASTGTYTSVGRSAVWRPDGTVLVQSDDTTSALLIATNTDGMWRGELALLDLYRPRPSSV